MERWALSWAAGSAIGRRLERWAFQRAVANPLVRPFERWAIRARFGREPGGRSAACPQPCRADEQHPADDPDDRQPLEGRQRPDLGADRRGCEPAARRRVRPELAEEGEKRHDRGQPDDRQPARKARIAMHDEIKRGKPHGDPAEVEERHRCEAVLGQVVHRKDADEGASNARRDADGTRQQAQSSGSAGSQPAHEQREADPSDDEAEVEDARQL